MKKTAIISQMNPKKWIKITLQNQKQFCDI